MSDDDDEHICLSADDDGGDDKVKILGEILHCQSQRKEAPERRLKGEKERFDLVDNL